MKIKTAFSICLLLAVSFTLQAQDLKSFKAENGKYGFRDEKGNIVVPGKYDLVNEFVEERAVVRIGYKYGFIDKKGNEVISVKYHYVKDFSEGLACVNIGTTFSPIWGFVDPLGKEVITPQYETSARFVDGKAYVKKNGRSFYINNTGKEVE